MSIYYVEHLMLITSQLQKWHYYSFSHNLDTCWICTFDMSTPSFCPRTGPTTTNNYQQVQVSWSALDLSIITYRVQGTQVWFVLLGNSLNCTWIPSLWFESFTFHPHNHTAGGRGISLYPQWLHTPAHMECAMSYLWPYCSTSGLQNNWISR